MKSNFSDTYHRPYFMGIAIFAIIMMHLHYSLSLYDGIDVTPLYNIFGYGAFGVDIFLFLSAYGLSCSLHNHTLRRFYSNRIRRIFPVYLLFLFFSLLLFVTHDPIEILKYVFSSISGLSGIRSFPYHVEWFTPCLILVYIFFPLIDKLGSVVSKMHVWLITCIIILMQIGFYTLHWGLYEFIWIRLHIILLGNVIYHLEQKLDGKVIQLLSILGLYGILLFRGNEFRVMLAMPAVLYLAGNAQRLPLHGFFSLLGKNSYEIYLAQFVATTYFMDHYHGNVFIELVGVVAIIVCMGFILFLVRKMFVK